MKILLLLSLVGMLTGCANMDADSTARTFEALNGLTRTGMDSYDRYNGNYVQPTPVYYQPPYYGY